MFLIILSFAFTCLGQSNISYPFKTNMDYNGMVYEWSQVGQQCPGCASLYKKAIRSIYKNKAGLYNYSILLYSNSYAPNGYLVSTYLTNVAFYATSFGQHERFLSKVNYVLVPPKNIGFDGAYVVLTFQSIYGNEAVRIVWQSMSTY